MNYDDWIKVDHKIGLFRFILNTKTMRVSIALDIPHDEYDFLNR